MWYYLFIYFAVGILQDVFWTMNVKYVANEKPALAASFSFCTSMISMGIFYDILTRLDKERSWIAIIVYSLGISVGTFIAMKSRFGKRKK